MALQTVSDAIKLNQLRRLVAATSVNDWSMWRSAIIAIDEGDSDRLARIMGPAVAFGEGTPEYDAYMDKIYASAAAAK